VEAVCHRLPSTQSDIPLLYHAAASPGGSVGEHGLWSSERRGGRHARNGRPHVLFIKELRVRHDVGHLVKEQVVIPLDLTVALLVLLLLLEILLEMDVRGRRLIVNGRLHPLQLLSVQVLAMLYPLVVQMLVRPRHAFAVRIHSTRSGPVQTSFRPPF